MGTVSGRWASWTYVLAAYLKNSVTRLVEPLRVIAWRVGACDVAMACLRNKAASACREGDHVEVFATPGISQGTNHDP
jgi:hypothetical protein